MNESVPSDLFLSVFLDQFTCFSMLSIRVSLILFHVLIQAENAVASEAMVSLVRMG